MAERATALLSYAMDHQKFLRHIRQRAPNALSNEIEARPYKNAKGVTEIIYLPKSYWNYVAWAEANTDIDFAAWVVHCDSNPTEGYTLSHQLMYWLWTDECNRFRAGDPTPNSYPPMGYEGWADEVHGNSNQL